MDTHGLVCEFGKHKGTLYTRVPVSYLKWMVNAGCRDSEIAKAELERRGSTTMPEMEITGHAIDRASLNCRKMWHEQRGENEGIHAWLHRVGLEAFKSGERLITGKVKHAGLKFVFEEGEEYPILKTVMPA